MGNKKKSKKPCPSCLKASRQFMRTEAVQPLPEGALAPLGLDGKPQCHDCAVAGTLKRLTSLTWNMARTAVANDRQEQYRLPGAPIGLVQKGLMKPSKKGDLESHQAWLREVGIWGNDEQ